MGAMKRRLTDLWRRQTVDAAPVRPSGADFSDGMVVTLKAPMSIWGTMLLPGRYTFRPLAAGFDGGPIQIINEAEARLIATIPSLPVNLESRSGFTLPSVG